MQCVVKQSFFTDKENKALDKQFVKCAGTLANKHANTLKYSGTQEFSTCSI